MTRQELGSKIHELCEDAERELNRKRADVAKERKYMREHNFDMENKALEYKDDAYSEADFILFELKRNIFELFEDNMDDSFITDFKQSMEE